MGSDDPARMKTPRITTQTLMNDLLMGQPSGRLPRLADKQAVADLMSVSRPRFDKKHPSVWLIVTIETEEITTEAKVDLRSGFTEFLNSGGTKVVLVVRDEKVDKTLRLLLHQAGVKDIVVERTVDAGSRICSAFREAVHKKATLKP